MPCHLNIGKIDPPHRYGQKKEGEKDGGQTPENNGTEKDPVAPLLWSIPPLSIGPGDQGFTVGHSCERPTKAGADAIADKSLGCPR